MNESIDGLIRYIKFKYENVFFFNMEKGGFKKQLNKIDTKIVTNITQNNG